MEFYVRHQNEMAQKAQRNGGITMPKVLTIDGSVKIGAYRFPDRKKPCLCVEKATLVRCMALSLTLTEPMNL